MQSKLEYYEVVIRNSWFLPAYKSSAITEAYLEGVVQDKIFCPKDRDVRLKNAYSLPTKEVLLAKILAIAE